MAILGPLLEHHRWANLGLVDALRSATPEQLLVRAPGAIYGAHECVVHLAYAEQAYCESILGTPMDLPEWIPGSPPSIDELATRLAATGAALLHAATQRDVRDTVSGTWRGRAFAEPVSAFLFNAVHHAAEHREQAKACLTLAGIEPPDIGFWTWHRLQSR